MITSKQSFQLNLSSGQNLQFQFGLFAPQANGSILATIGGTTVLATVVLGQVDQTKDYFPLSVEFQDKLYAGGIIRDSKWLKREGGLDDESILLGRLIDRSIRPLFPKGFQNEVQVIVSVLSNDKQTDVSILAFNAVSLALSLSDIPFSGPVSASQVGLVDNQLIVNPTSDQLANSDLNLTVCTGPFGVNMIEAGAKVVDDQVVLDAISQADQNNQNINSQIHQLQTQLAKTKIEFTPLVASEKLMEQITSFLGNQIDSFFSSGHDDGKHVQAESSLFSQLEEHFQPQLESEEMNIADLKLAFDEVIRTKLRQRTMSSQTRFDGRKLDQIRPVFCQTGILSQVHGSALFQRGLTQALTITTLGPLSDKQYSNNSAGDKTKTYMHFYNAPPYSTGQTGRLGRPGRREVGHGALAEKALLPVIPSPEVFPYTILVNSEVLSQNGSSSMASTCGSTLSLMDAGVPITDMVGGVSIGMMSDNDSYILLTDIAGIEDHCGDMDFKITGTKTGITAIQLDVKRPGLTIQMITDTFKASRQARLAILEIMSEVISSPRSSLSANAPKVALVKIPEEKIGEVIGPGGKMIKALMKKHQVQIDIDDDGQASISSQSQENTSACAKEISNMTREITIGEEFDGVVTRVEPYGAFVELVSGREALLHVSELSTGFIADVNKIIKIGDKIHVEVAGRNQENQIKLSARQFKSEHTGDSSQPRPAFNRPIGKFVPPRHLNRADLPRKTN